MAKQKRNLNQADLKLLRTIFLTKQEAKQFATKDDLSKLEKRFQATFATKLELDNLKYELEDKMTHHRDDLMTKLDKILKEILTSRQEQKIMVHRISDNTKRLTSIETKLQTPN